MNWLLSLYQTYQSNVDLIGEVKSKWDGSEYMLLPVSHTTQSANIEVLITEDGEFHSATVINKDGASTVIPCTEKSASRTGKGAYKVPHPLHDKLAYVAGDICEYGGDKKAEESFGIYIKELKKWIESPYATEKLKNIYQYLSKKQLVRDLVESKILWLDKDQKLIGKWDKKFEDFLGGKPEIFRVLPEGQEAAFVRFTIYSSHKVLAKIWKDQEMYHSFIRFYDDFLGDEDYCYVTGEIKPRADKHPSKIRHIGDQTKLISSNDSSGFTYRGRFNTANEVANISYDVSQKAHHALKWLINKQGKVIDGRVFLVWGNDVVEAPDVTDDSFDLVSMGIAPKEEQGVVSYTHEHFANEVAKAIDGYKNDVTSHAKINILLLDSSNPSDSATTGRLAVLYYRNIDKDLYLNRLKDWHTTCAWEHCYRKDDEKRVIFYGAPSTKDIAFAAYGPRASDKVVKGLMERMLPCIVDGKEVPFDIVRSAFQRASNPVSMENWEWEKTLSIACALINKKEGYTVELSQENSDRDYLFGRLLAVADVLERRALDSNEKRATNARRYMNSFAQHPERTWRTIQGALQPYQARLGEKVWYYNKLIDEIGSKIKIEDFNNKPLSGKYLLGFYSQRHELCTKKEKNISVDEATNTKEEK